MGKKEHTFHIVQIGLGVVGYGYYKAISFKGFKVSGIEHNMDLVKKYKNEMEIYHTSDNLNNIKNVDFIFISVPTPLKGDELDMTYLFSTLNNVATIIKNNPDAFVILRSTVNPNTTRLYKDKLEQILNHTAICGFNPEFLRAKTAFSDALHPWFCCLSLCNTDISLRPLIDFYSHFIDRDRISVISVEEAELLKLFHNSFNAAKISFFNQCFLLTEAMNKKNGTNIDMNIISTILPKTAEGLINPKYGLKVGSAFAGSCLSKDPNQLASLEKEYNLDSQLFKSVVEVNENMKQYEKDNNLPEYIYGHHQISHDKMKI